MRKTFITLVVLMLALVAGCKKKPEEPEDLTFTFTGLTDVNLTVGDTFDLMQGVKVMGSDEVDYTDKVAILVASSAITKEGNVITAVSAGEVLIRYRVTVTVGENQVEDTQFRNVVIITPPKPEGELVANGDFSDSMAFWDTYLGVGNMELDFEENALKVTLTAVGAAYEPRVTQMGIPFEKGKAYKISFKAKALAPKKINAQVGELLANDPWFVDFKPGQTVHFDITTEWAEYSYEFIMNLENDRGGVLFEFGTVGGDATITTIWLTDVKAEEVEISPDTEAPEITVRNLEILKGSALNLENYVSAFDIRDGEIPFADLDIVIKKDGAVVAAIDTDVEGDYVVSVTATDKAGNSATETFTVSVVGMTFQEANLVVNGDFAKAIDTETPEWNLWVPDWESISEATMNIVDGELEIDVTKAGSAGWHIQVYQEGMFEFVEGKTYRFKFDLRGPAAANVGFEVIDGIDAQNPVKFLEGVASVTTEMQTFEYIFTVTKPVELDKFLFMLGGLELGKYYLDNVSINEANTQKLLQNNNLMVSPGWTSFHNSWAGIVIRATYDGKFRMEVDQLKDNGQNWVLQFIQNGSLLPEPTQTNNYLPLTVGETYTLKFDAQASKDWVVRPLVANDNGWANLIAEADRSVTVTNTLTTYTITFTVPEDWDKEVAVFKIEFGSGIAAFDAAEGVMEWIEFDNVSLKGEDGVELIYNGAIDPVIPHWIADHAGGGAGCITLTPAAEGGKVTTTLVGGEAYIPHFHQSFMINEAGTYNFKMVINSNVARTLRLNFVVPNEGWRSLLEDNKYDLVITTEEVGTDIVVEFSITILEPIPHPVKFELDFGKIVEGDVAGEFILKQILLYKVY